jgi:hypothetical protein
MNKTKNIRRSGATNERTTTRKPFVRDYLPQPVYVSLEEPYLSIHPTILALVEGRCPQHSYHAALAKCVCPHPPGVSKHDAAPAADRAQVVPKFTIAQTLDAAISSGVLQPQDGIVVQSHRLAHGYSLPVAKTDSDSDI